MNEKNPNHRSSKPKNGSNGRKLLTEAGLSAMISPALPDSKERAAQPEPLEIEREQAIIEEIWSRRAAVLAQAPVETDSSEQIELVMVRLGSEIYGMEVEYISSIRPAEQITRVPRVPAWVGGVFNLRGNILSVLDLKKFFGLPDGVDSSGQTTGQVLVVVKTWDMELAILVDEVLAIEPVPASQIQATSDILHGIRPEYVRGVAERSRSDTQNGTGENLLLVLDLPALVADPQLVIDDDVL
jgi:purine-binding chemotaxis protein CheW